MSDVALSGNERRFAERDVIVSKTDLKGRITYANRTFMNISGFSERELLGQPHSIIRHPEMPRAVFALLWDRLKKGQEVFAYVINRARNGDHYWVLAHVTPSHNAAGEITGYHSNRRVPDHRIVNETIRPLYRRLLEEESRHANRKEGMQASSCMLYTILDDAGLSYEGFIDRLLKQAA